MARKQAWKLQLEQSDVFGNESENFFIRARSCRDGNTNFVAKYNSLNANRPLISAFDW